MELIDNINRLLGDDLKASIGPGSKVRIAASCFSIYAFEALKEELERVDSFEFVFTSPTFTPDEVTDSGRKQRREFHIPPRQSRERGFYGTEFEIQLKNKLTQRAIAKECADWMRRKARFRSNRTNAQDEHLAGDRFNYDVLCHTDLQRTSGESFGTPPQSGQLGQLRPLSSTSRTTFATTTPTRDRETRHEKLMRSVIRGVKTKVLMLSATPVNNRST
ncbi:MAG: hypothetical protein R3B46_13155 [Phycisphaerales bacterium]